MSHDWLMVTLERRHGLITVLKPPFLPKRLRSTKSYFIKAIDHTFYGFTGVITRLGCWENTRKACKSRAEITPKKISCGSPRKLNERQFSQNDILHIKFWEFCLMCFYSSREIWHLFSPAPIRNSLTGVIIDTNYTSCPWKK